MDLPGELRLAGDRHLVVRVVNVGELGALVAITDLEDAVLEGERALLVCQVLEDGRITDDRIATPGAIVRADLEFQESGVSRHVAIYFDGGGVPPGVSPPDGVPVAGVADTDTSDADTSEAGPTE